MPESRRYHGRRDLVQWDTFNAACRAADAKRATELRPDDHLDFLRRLMDVSLAQAYAEIHRRHLEGRAAASTVEALMLGLRDRGVAALKEAPMQRRLGSLSEPHLHEVCERLQKLNPEIANPWSPDEASLLIEAWVICHAQ